jgi:large subunit ribosomal protein L1
MPKHSKRFASVSSKVDAKKTYPIAEAIALVKETATTKFDGAVELHVRLGIDPKKGEQQVRGAVTLPHGTGKTKKIAAFVSGDKQKDAEDAGADVVGGEELIDKIRTTGKIDFEIAIATPDMMPKLAVIAKVLGPVGLMPSPKNETITTNVAKTIGELKKGKISFKNDDTGNVHVAIGRSSFTTEQLEANFAAVVDAIRRVKPTTSKGNYILNVSVASSMGPGVRTTLA